MRISFDIFNALLFFDVLIVKTPWSKVLISLAAHNVHILVQHGQIIAYLLFFFASVIFLLVLYLARHSHLLISILIWLSKYFGSLFTLFLLSTDILFLKYYYIIPRWFQRDPKIIVLRYSHKFDWQRFHTRYLWFQLHAK